ncbi:MAG: nucleotidyltransferase domain-containing protein [Roseiflexaceae bacterium]|nr:nucleotidyltransferase domain-containing protein [Roseiflexaceae bacterium]
MAECLVETFQPERVYLFGSTARGDAGPDSDYDFIVVVADSQQSSYQRSIQGQRALAPFQLPKDVIVWTKDQFDKRLYLVASLPATVVREGVLLYER